MSEIVRKNLVKFAPKGKDSFYDVLKIRVNDYFKTNKITPYSNTKMHIKTIIMLSLYFVPYIIIVTHTASSFFALSPVLYYLLWVVMGFGIVGIGTSIMHDSNHGSYSKNRTVNRLLGYVLNLIGGYSLNWKIQHNVLHHTYTNLDGLDEDIDAGPLRMTPDKPWKKYHRFQHIYAWFLYCLMNLYWITAKDYVLLFRYHKSDLLQNQKTNLRKALIHLTFLKALYFTTTLIVPILFSGIVWYHVLLGLIIMHVIAGFSLAAIFQPAHVVESSEFPHPSDTRRIQNNWAVHQILNTADFAPNNKLICWYIGGLNFQIEHHLFPHICHIHYPEIAKIVQQVAKEYNLPYTVFPTFRSAVKAHGKMLWLLGNNENLPGHLNKTA